MCGIAGFWNFNGSRANSELLRRMAGMLTHRGPDADGIHLQGPVGLAHTRLSIIDLAGGRQPMANADGSLWLTFNGEIFNYLELREELQQKGHRFSTQSDTEVILHLYAEYGEDCVQRMNGQWAFALWDEREKKLFLSRDRIGIRPLYYSHNSDRLVFGSEIKALLAHPKVPREIDVFALDQLFTFWSPLTPRTLFKNIQELPPGHCMTVRNGDVQLRRYWQLEYDGDSRERPVDEYADELLDLLVDATRLRLRSDVPVGAYLSGGLDSSLTTALIRRFTDAELSTFSVSFDDPEFDESRFQNDMIGWLHTRHQGVRCSYDTIGRIFPEVIRHTEKPVLRTAPAPLYLLSQLVRQNGYKVVMTGEGADEMLGGYDIFKEAKTRRFWSRQPESSLRPRLLKQLYPYMKQLQAQPTSYLKAFFRVRPEDMSNPFFSHLPRWELTSRLKIFFSPEVREQLKGYDAIDEFASLLPEDYSRWHPLCRAQYLEAANLLPGYILSSQGDRMTMANSVEGRFPFLDYRVMEMASRIPPRMKMKGLDEKHVLKRAAGSLVPNSIRKRSKQPYRAPDAASFFDSDLQRPRFDYVRELLDPQRIQEDGLFHPRAVEKLVEKVQNGQAIGTRDNMALVGILSTQLMVQQLIRELDVPSASSAGSTENVTIRAGNFG